MLTTGKDYDYVRDQMDLPRLYALNEYQLKFPPADIGVQRLCRILEAFMGIEENQQQEESEEDDLEEMLSAFPQG
ncbi:MULTISPECIES: hypothetical protein [unclassified Acinetobacter]|uniref:hypothetical protein n=1 Tax=unclassified Acinetobacter TaxID=196816 RepID=UPI0025767E90|nr:MULTISPECIES: hypothetical protein [unclassified Acinetobacter]